MWACQFLANLKRVKSPHTIVSSKFPSWIQNCFLSHEINFLLNFLRTWVLVAVSAGGQRRARSKQVKLSRGKQAMRSGHHLIGTARHKPDDGIRNPSVAFRQTVLKPTTLDELYNTLECG
ncbi:hypothetical protein C8R45DRAFT_936064 [Mycena sanguinolenta]|nr:hypothetical protein C8R45DRAFT_936064 [Mycena sanguinolenta]